jgi:hypothetical protein
MKPNKQILALLFVGAMITGTAHAGLFGDEGNERCGIGTMLFKNIGNSISSNSTENSFNSGETFSVTTGTSGCSNSGFTQATPEEIYYANANHQEIISEMANGGGEIITGFAHTLGCNDVATQHFLQISKKNYSRIVPESKVSPIQVLKNIKNQINSDAVLRQGCHSFNA